MKTLKEQNEINRERARPIIPEEIKPQQPEPYYVGANIACDKCGAEMQKKINPMAVSLAYREHVKCPGCGYEGFLESDKPRPIVTM